MKQTQNQTSHYLDRYSAIRGVFLGSDALVYEVEKQKTVAIEKIFDGVRNDSNANPVSKIKTKSSFLNKAWNSTLNLIIILAFGATTIWFGPKLYATLFPNNQEMAQAQELQGNFELDFNQENREKEQVVLKPEKYLPPKNENLPEGDWLIIPRIGVRSQLQPTEDYREALVTGLWIAPEFGQPGDLDLPMIVAGHRFGFEWWWQDDYWKYHSFYLLPELEPGDRIEVISDQRKWIYEIYAGEEGEQITDYQADMIVYTCKHLDSPTRLFKYAKLVR